MHDNIQDNIIFSIVIATYNRGDIIGDTLKSLLDQTYRHFEIIVVDDGSKDNTRDILNAWSVTKEAPADIYPAISKYIHHVHVKDGVIKDGKVQYRILGKGEAPVRESIQLLQKGGFQGYYSFEWEKLWHPEIEEPEIALAQYPAEILKYFV